MGANYQPVWTPQPNQNQNKRRNTLPGALIFLALGIATFFLFNRTKDDFQLMEELMKKSLWASIEHLSAVLRLCQSGNRNACKILDEYPEHRNAYIPTISRTPVNGVITELYAKNVVSKKIKDVVGERYETLGEVFVAGLEKVKRIPKMTKGIIDEIAWILLEHGYDPTDWMER